MKRTSIAVLTLLTLLLFVPSLAIPRRALAQANTALKVEPQSNSFSDDTTSVGATFTISVIASDIPTDNKMFGWEFVLTWTPALINCTTETINYGIWAAFLGPWISTPIDNTIGEYHQSLTGRSPGVPVSGTYWLVNLTFTIVKGPAPGETLTSSLTLQKAPGYTAYCLLTINSEEIPHDFINGVYSFASSQAPTTFNLTISANAGGTTDPAPGVHSYVSGTSVQVTAINNSGYYFDHWVLDAQSIGSTNPTTVIMNADHALTAVFKIIPPPGGLHDIAVNKVVSSKTMIPENYTYLVDFIVTIENLGTVSETVNLMLTANAITIATWDVVISVGETNISTLHWNVTGVAKGNYTITAHASPVTNETDTANNSAENWVFITIKGDINGDKTVNAEDAVLLGRTFGSKPGGDKWNPDADLNNDGYVNIRDVMLLGTNFGSSWA